ncbi:hypothetical protein HO173_008359 [Letharia columbiana]|uniref:Uncharacterized protein n=1 Tax=Letharia columbiana TaxID=112416 RepID=A0A8H6FRM1_9LECA|nr:uncharacterized protein HO173_008359 [Letharia columbiana]KAF6233427.1 hypothetical protein HO173_008359 [Letharia columbiana]
MPRQISLLCPGLSLSPSRDTKHTFTRRQSALQPSDGVYKSDITAPDDLREAHQKAAALVAPVENVVNNDKENDPTNGYVNYLDASDAQAANLAGVVDDVVTIRSDSSNIASGRGRDSVRVTSRNQ